MVELLQTSLFYLGVGAFAGLIAGMLGVGGGLIIVPAVVWLLHLQGVADAVIMHTAIGTSLATMVITALSSVWAHHRHKAVLWQVFRRLAPGIVVGAWLGAAIASALPGDSLRVVFGVFALVVAARMGFGGGSAPHRSLPGAIGMTVAGTVIGMLSALVGIGGGTLTVPFLTWCNTSIRNAVATSAACGLPIAVAGATGFMVTGWGKPDLPPWSAGYVYGPAVAGISVASMLFAPWGARLAHTLPKRILLRVFAGFLVVVGATILMG